MFKPVSCNLTGRLKGNNGISIFQGVLCFYLNKAAVFIPFITRLTMYYTGLRSSLPIDSVHFPVDYDVF